jgi:hypothetical protein
MGQNLIAPQHPLEAFLTRDRPASSSFKLEDMKRFNRAFSDEQCSYLNIQVKWAEDNLMTVMTACPVTVSQGNNPYLGRGVRE